NDRQAKTRIVKATLEGAGLSQAINYSLVDKARATDFALQDRSTISLLMPMSEAHATLRQSLIPHLIDDVSYNVARSNHHVAIYELGRVFFGNGKDQLPDEVEYLSGILTGDYAVNTWQSKKEAIDFFVAKGVVERIAEILDVQFEYEADEISGLHPGRNALIKVKSVSVGYINYQPIPRFPGVSRDIALVINRAMPSAKIVNVIKNNGGDILQNAEVFDVYEGEHVAEDEKSIALRLSYLDTKQT